MEIEVLVAVQQGHLLLEADGRDHAVDRVSDGDPFQIPGIFRLELVQHILNFGLFRFFNNGSHIFQR